ncbi:MAG: hypothetical protein AAGJ09_15555 [Pseudomonadota bacterium]
MCERPSNKERYLKSFELADAAIKLVLTLTTGTIGGAIALFDDKNTAGVQFANATCLISWGLGILMLSTISGLLAINNIAGTMLKPATPDDGIYKGSIRLFWSTQLAAFAVGLLLLIIAALY